MGRTNPTFRDRLRGLEEEWARFRRGLRRRDRAHFDRLFVQAHEHADAAGLQNAHDPLRPVLVAVLLAQERRLARLEAELDAASERRADITGSESASLALWTDGVDVADGESGDGTDDGEW